NDETGMTHGLMFADGSVNYRYANGDFGHMMRLCGDKERFKDRFDRYSYQPNCNGDPVVYHRSGFNMKELPSTEDPNYVRSFIQGWLEFDGSNGAISTQNEKAARWLEEHAAIGGFQVVGHTAMDNGTNFGKRSAPLHRIKLVDTAGLWTVKSITPLGITTEVLCAVVDGFERFTLASGVYTSNCGFTSTGDMTRNDPAKPFKFLMEASMLGVGVGFDLKGADKGFKLHKPVGEETYVIPDTREGWVESVGMLLEAFLKPGKPNPRFDYSQIRPEGAPIKTFGGQAAGPEPLKRLHSQISGMFKDRDDYLTGMDILDIMNLIGVCVVAGNVRRSAELAIGEADDLDFINAKNPEVFPGR